MEEQGALTAFPCISRVKSHSPKESLCLCSWVNSMAGGGGGGGWRGWGVGGGGKLSRGCLKFCFSSTFIENNLSQYAAAWLLGNHKLKASLGYVVRPHERREGGRIETVWLW